MIDNQFVEKQVNNDFADYYPSGDEMQAQISGRHTRGKLFFLAVLAATLTAIIALLVLLTTIINQSFGLVAEQVEIPEISLVTDFNKTRVLAASNIVESSEDDQSLAQGIGDDPLGAGFFGYAFYSDNQAKLNALSVDGVAPTLESVLSGDYPGTRPIFLYSAAEVVKEQPQVAAFLAYYLQNLEVVSEVGYFAADKDALAAQQEAILTALGVSEAPQINPADFDGEIMVAGSSTVYPITREIAEMFKKDGFQGEVIIESSGTGGGFNTFCTGSEGVDIVDASRPVDTIEFEACRRNDLTLTEYLIGKDAVVAAVSEQNDFAADVTREQMELLFTEATTWADVNAAWPAENIDRYIPTADSGTMDIFVRSVFDEQTLDELSYYALVDILSTNVTAGRCRAIERENRFYLDQLVCDDPEAFATACASENPPTGCADETRTHDELVRMITTEVIQPKILRSWYLIPSILRSRRNRPRSGGRFPKC